MNYENPVVQMYRRFLDGIGIKKYVRDNGSLLTKGEAGKLKDIELYREFFDRPTTGLEGEVNK